MRWSRVKAAERGREWTDWISEDGQWRAAEGYDEPARLEDGRPWTLFRRLTGVWRWVSTHASLAAAKGAAS